MNSKSQLLFFAFVACLVSWKFFSEITISPNSLAIAESVKPMHVISKVSTPNISDSYVSPNQPTQNQNSSTNQNNLLNPACILAQLDSAFRPNSEDMYYGIKLEIPEEPLLILIKSPNCPAGTHSLLYATKTNNRWSIQKSLDCRYTDPTELYENFRVGGQMTQIGERSGELNLALSSTTGDFLTLCDSGFVSSRRGHFRLDEFELYRDENDCLLMTQDMQPFRTFNSLSDIGLIETWSEKNLRKQLIEPGRVALTLNGEDIPFYDPSEESFMRGFVEVYNPNSTTSLGIPEQFFEHIDFEKDCKF